VVKVLDFGLVKSFLFSDDELTQQGSIGGTPAYIAPERLRKETVDHRSDIFSLGAVGYYLLTGRPAFQGETSYVTLERVLSAQPTRPSEISDAVPDDLEDLVLRCLAKSPADRPADLGVVISELTEVTERYPWTQADARGWWEAYEAREALERVAGETSSN
jgi:serine/threonine-protein kinase